MLLDEAVCSIKDALHRLYEDDATSAISHFSVLGFKLFAKNMFMELLVLVWFGLNIARFEYCTLGKRKEKRSRFVWGIPTEQMFDCVSCVSSSIVHSHLC